ncbi:MAG: PIN domain-containing protein [Proteobacteria bacterium]|nr:PIN domain-containing protein [Pseudomonadota bacterium]
MVARSTDSVVEFAPDETIAVDSAPIIYYLEDHAQFAERYAALFEAADAGQIQIVISTIAIAEVLAGPLMHGNEILAARYREALTAAPYWTVLDVDTDVAEQAARLRVRYKIRLPDAIQIATALRANADRFVTHDRRLQRVKELRVVGLS